MNTKMKFDKRKLPRIIVTTVATILIIIGTIALVGYARGYRINNNRSVERTGVLNVESDPLRTTLYVDGNRAGTTPKTVSSLQKGFHKIDVKRDNYHEWSTQIDIKAEKSTPIFPFLFLIEPEKESVFSIDQETYEIDNVPDSGYIFITTSRQLSQSEIGTAGQNSLYKSIWRFDTNPRFWDTAQNPSLLYESDIPGDTQFETIFSNTGEYALLLTDQPTEGSSEKITQVYLLDTSSQNNEPTLLDLIDYYGEYDILWDKTDTHLVLESSEEILSFNLSSGEKILMTRKTENTIWNTDDEGNFYYTELIAQTDAEPAHIQIKQIPLSGGSPEVFIDKIFFTSDDKYLLSQEELMEREEPYTFKNSPNSSQFAGLIKNLNIHNDVQMMTIGSEYAFYAYDLESDKYTLISSKPGIYHQIAEDEEKLLFISDEQLYLYTFDKEDADHTSVIGVKRIMNAENARNITLFPNSRIVLYSEGDEVKTIDIKRENKLTVYETPGGFFLLDDSGENIYTIDKSELPNTIQKVKIN